MSLSAAFNDSYRAEKENDSVLSVRYRTGGYETSLSYDFTARVMIARTISHGDGGIVLTPFSQLDRETLVAFRDQLAALGGKPPDLPPEEPPQPVKRNALNL